MNIYEVGKPYPGAIPRNEGPHFEIGPDGDMQLIVQFPKPDAAEKKALSEGFRQYSLYRHEGPVILACWVFKFPAPVSYVDAPFFAGLYTDGRIEKFKENSDWNALNVTILDGDIIQSMRVVGLQPEAMTLFRNVVAEQPPPPSPYLYNVAVDSLFKMNSKEIFQRGKIFTSRDK